MFYTQKYENYNQIEPEFIAEIERLTSEIIPSFEWIKNEWDRKKESEVIFYLLIFHSSKNAPIGFAHIKRDQKEHSSLIKKLLAKSKFDFQYNWSLSGNQGLFIEEPVVLHHKKEILDLLLKFGKELDQGEHFIFSSTLISSDDYQLDKRSFHPLIKTHHNYAQYLNSLESSILKEVKKFWYDFQVEQLNISEYARFKDIFAYRKRGRELYKKLKEQFEIYQRTPCFFYTIEASDKIIGIVFLVPGADGHFFFDYVSLIQQDIHLLLSQVATMYFYENDSAHYLHAMVNEPFLPQLGFKPKTIYFQEYTQ